MPTRTCEDPRRRAHSARFPSEAVNDRIRNDDGGGFIFMTDDLVSVNLLSYISVGGEKHKVIVQNMVNVCIL